MHKIWCQSVVLNQTDLQSYLKLCTYGYIWFCILNFHIGCKEYSWMIFLKKLMRRKIGNITDLLKSKIRRAEWNVVGLPIYSDVLLIVIRDSEIDLQNLLIKIFPFIKNMLEKQEMIMKINETSLKRTISFLFCLKNIVLKKLSWFVIAVWMKWIWQRVARRRCLLKLIKRFFQNLLICDLFCNLGNNSSKYGDWLWKKVTTR